MTELLYRVLRLLDERENAGTLGAPTIGDIANSMGMSFPEVAFAVKSLEAMDLVAIRRPTGAEEENYAVVLKSPAYAYLETHRPASMAKEIE
jgi:DNA-binding transcriptional regulator GbsR (MarR family)